MVAIFCHTNLDLCPCEAWPSELPEVPRVGDLIQSKHKWGECQLELKVCRVVWKYAVDRWLPNGNTSTGWYPAVEMGVPSAFNSLTDFYEWYGRVCGRGKHAFI